jgi:UDP:flavonoid glycosyltransferase YjiC (YdhE family)
VAGQAPGDQPDNAARLVHRGAGVKVSKKASSAKIAAALRKVLDDPTYQIAAPHLGERSRAEADRGAALAELEALAVGAEVRPRRDIPPAPPSTDRS